MRARPHRRFLRFRHFRRDAGQVTIEFLGMTPLILVTLVLLWQFVLLGYTFTLAGNAADEAVRAATAAAPGSGRPRASRRDWTSCPAPGAAR